MPKHSALFALALFPAPAAAQTSEEMRAIIAKQQAQIDALTARLTALEARAAEPVEAAAAAPAPANRAGRGAPRSSGRAWGRCGACS